MRPLSKVTKRSIKVGVGLLAGLTVLVQPATGQGFPMESCGDGSDPNATTWYPVIVRHLNLEQVASRFCQDAFAIDLGKGIEGVQLASFSSLERAENFAQFVGGEIGEVYRVGEVATTPSQPSRRGAPMPPGTPPPMTVQATPTASTPTPTIAVAAVPEDVLEYPLVSISDLVLFPEDYEGQTIILDMVAIDNEIIRRDGEMILRLYEYNSYEGRLNTRISTGTHFSDDDYVTVTTSEEMIKEMREKLNMRVDDDLLYYQIARITLQIPGRFPCEYSSCISAWEAQVLKLETYRLSWGMPTNEVGFVFE